MENHDMWTKFRGKTLYNFALFITARVPPCSYYHADGSLVIPFDLGHLLESLVYCCINILIEAGLHPHHYGLPLWIAHSHIEFKHVGFFCTFFNHYASIKEALERITALSYRNYSRLHDVFY